MFVLIYTGCIIVFMIFSVDLVFTQHCVTDYGVSVLVRTFMLFNLYKQSRRLIFFLVISRLNASFLSQPLK